MQECGVKVVIHIGLQKFKGIVFNRRISSFFYKFDFYIFVFYTFFFIIQSLYVHFLYSSLFICSFLMRFVFYTVHFL